MLKSRLDYIKDMSYAIGVMRDEGKDVDFLVRHVGTLKAIYPNLDTRIDLHEMFLEESRHPLLPLYVTKMEVYMIQTYGRVPDENSEIYKSLQKAFNRQDY